MHRVSRPRLFLTVTNGYLNGSKIFITNGKEADVYVIFAVTGTD